MAAVPDGDARITKTCDSTGRKVKVQAAGYNPIVRKFGGLRGTLTFCTGMPRKSIRPSSLLDSLLPVKGRRRTWRRLQELGIDVRNLELESRPALIGCLSVLISTIALTIALGDWLSLFAIVPFSAICYWISRPFAVAFPLGLKTAGEIALYLTHLSEHPYCHYRPTRNEIAFKVRLVIAELYCRNLDEIRLTTTLPELEPS